MAVKEKPPRVRDYLFPFFLVVCCVLIYFATTLTRGRTTGVLPAARRKAIANVALSDLAGTTWRLDEHRGQVVLINFWATWCAPCREETPGLVSLATRYRARGLEVVGITLDEGNREGVERFVREYRIPYPILLPDSGTPPSVDVSGLPVTVLIDRRGKVAKTYRGAVEASVVQADVESLLAEQVQN